MSCETLEMVKGELKIVKHLKSHTVISSEIIPKVVKDLYADNSRLREAGENLYNYLIDISGALEDNLPSLFDRINKKQEPSLNEALRAWEGKKPAS